MNNLNLHKKDVVYYTRIMPTIGTYDVCDLIIRTVTNEYFVGIDKYDKHAYLFPYSAINNTIYLNRLEALEKVTEEENNKKNSQDTDEEYYYEEY